MERLTTTPFGARPITAALIDRARRMDRAEPALPRVDKWSLLTDLTEARAAFGVTERELAVLHALLSFHPSRELEEEIAAAGAGVRSGAARPDEIVGSGFGAEAVEAQEAVEDAPAPLIVFPSNVSLSARAHGLPESTLRRRLARLVEAGLIARHDSPNGKRYAARDRSGAIRRAFGFDLRPLLLRAAEIAQAAQAARDTRERARRAREAASLRLRDAAKLLAYGQETAPSEDWAPLEARLAEQRRTLRRRLPPEALREAAAAAAEVLAEVRGRLLQTEEPSGSDARSERRHQSSKPDASASEPCHEDKGSGPAEARATEPPSVPFPLVRRACPQVALYARTDLRSWDDLVAAAETVRGMMGVSPDAWARARAAMGPPAAATALAAMLERFEEIRNPGGYLRALTAKAEADGFSPAPMVMALLNRQERQAAA